MYRRILVPLDGSDASRAALGFADRLACDTLRLLRVEPNEPVLIPSARIGIAPGWMERHAEHLREGLNALGRPLEKEGRTVETDVRYGDAAEQIIDSAKSADLIVMTTHGRGAAGRAIFGSTADRVARHGTIPTLLLRRGAHATEPATPGRVVVPLDGSALAERAIPEAAKLAGTLNVPIHLVRAVDLDHVVATLRERSPIDAPGASSDDRYEQARLETERQAATYLEEQASAPWAEGLTVDTEILKGTPAFVLLWLLKPEDVVVMTTHGLGGYRRWAIGSVAEKLVRESPGPVLLVREGASALSGEEASSGA
ncbi:MAG: universal stress protein [Chloroflexia bacterium]|nr:universal stress protein [Chloroflexia bacterium]